MFLKKQTEEEEWNLYFKFEIMELLLKDRDDIIIIVLFRELDMLGILLGVKKRFYVE